MYSIILVLFAFLGCLVVWKKKSSVEDNSDKQGGGQVNISDDASSSTSDDTETNKDEEDEENTLVTEERSSNMHTYDMQISFNCAEQLGGEGWDIILSERLQKKLDEWVTMRQVLDISMIDEVNNVKKNILNVEFTDALSEQLFGKSRFCVVTGGFDKGKTWLVNMIANKKFPSGYIVETKGISIVSDINIDRLDKAGIIIGDTEGTGRALTAKECAAEEFSLKTQYPTLYKPKTIDPKNIRSDKKTQEENEIAAQTLQQIAFKNAAMINNNTERLLQQVIVESADVIITVVGETSSAEQQYVNIIIERLNSIIEESSPEKKVTYVLVHNFKNCKTKEEMKKLIDRYIVGVWGGITTNKPNIQGPVFVTPTLKSVTLEHVYLGHQDTEAGSENEVFIQRIRDKLLENASIGPKKNSVLSSLIQNIKSQLPEIYRKVHDVRIMLERHPNKNIIKLVHINPTNFRPEPLQLLTIEGEARDYKYVGRDHKWSPHYDMIIKSDEKLILNIDVPGMTFRFPTSTGLMLDPRDMHVSSDELMANYAFDELNTLTIGCFVGQSHFHVFGNRSLTHPHEECSESNNESICEKKFDYKEDENDSSSFISYANENNDMVKTCVYDSIDHSLVEWVHKKRNFGRFYLKIACPCLSLYDVAKATTKEHKGILHVTIPAIPKIKPNRSLNFPLSNIRLASSSAPASNASFNDVL